MSDLQRSFAKAKLSNLPFNPPRPLHVLDNNDDTLDEAAEEEDAVKPLPSPNVLPEDDSSSASSASSVSSTGTVMPSPSQKLFARGKAPQTSASRFAPLPWTTFFTQELHLTPPDPSNITHHLYLTAPLSARDPLFIMHHGAGSSALSFAAVTSHIRRLLPGAGVLALDARGHGETVVPPITSSPTAYLPASSPTSPILDLSLPALSQDLERAYASTAAHMGWSEDVPVVLVGHSLGGAVVATVAKEGRLKAKVLAFAVLDVVEGSAIDALQSMTAYLATRPRSFASVEEGVEWHLRSRTVRTAASARASVPALLLPERPEVPAFASASVSGAGGGEAEGQGDGTGAKTANGFDGDGDATADGEGKKDTGTTPRRWTWRTDLAATQPFWEGWFVGLSSKFLTARGGKLLLLAGTDRLDKELMIGQMQGKYQLQVFPEAGHFVHEDSPEKTATVLVDFWKRNDGLGIVLPRKVGDLIKEGVKV